MLTVKDVPSGVTDIPATDMVVSWVPLLLKNHTSLAPPRFAPVIVTVVVVPLFKVEGLIAEITGPVVTETAWLGANSVIGRPRLIDTPREKTAPRLLGSRTLTWACPNIAGCKILVAWMVTLAIAPPGAVYSPPLVIVPTEWLPPAIPLTLQVT